MGIFAIFAAFASGETNRRGLAILTILSKPLNKRQGLCNQQCRSLQGNMGYTVDACTGGIATTSRRLRGS